MCTRIVSVVIGRKSLRIIGIGTRNGRNIALEIGYGRNIVLKIVNWNEELFTRI